MPELHTAPALSCLCGIFSTEAELALFHFLLPPNQLYISSTTKIGVLQDYFKTVLRVFKDCLKTPLRVLKDSLQNDMTKP